MTLKTRKPTGKPAWPIMLIAGAEKAGKTYSAAQASASKLIGRTLWVGVGEDDPDEYGALPGVRFEIVEHDGTYRGILAALTACAAEPMEEGRPNLIVLDSATRLWDLKPGDQRDMYVIFEDEIYDLTVHALRYEEVETRLGKFTTLVLEPRMEKSPPLGMFKRGSTVRVWIAQDERRLPVKFQVEFAFGAGVATLVDYQPPSSAVSDSSSADAATSDMDTAPSTP